MQPRPFHLTTRRRAATWLLMLCLVTAQLLGTMHRIVHAPAPALASGPSAAASGHADAGNSLSSLFAVHLAGDSSCKLYDASSQGNAGPLLLPLLPTPQICFLALAFQSAPASPAPAPFEARAPPFSR